MKNTQSNAHRKSLSLPAPHAASARPSPGAWRRTGLPSSSNYAGRAADASAVVQEIQAAGGRATAIQADVSSAAEVAAMFDQIETTFGGVDVLVNNAGIMQPGLVPLAETDDALLTGCWPSM